MDLPSLRQLRLKRVILASGSPRRKEILNNLSLTFDIIPSEFEETLDKSSFAHPKDYVLQNALEKSLDVYRRLIKMDRENLPHLVVGADTIVVLGTKILEKPKSEGDAFEMLRSLSGQSHQVLTAVALIYPANEQGDDFRTRVFVEETEVFFAELSDEMIEAYIRTGEPLDKAGAYGYQGLASFFVKKINGDYWNVVGFPTCRFLQELEDLIKKGEL